jgi:hypothetical protein
VSIPELANKVQCAVKLGDAQAKTDREIHNDVRALVGHLTPSQLDELHDHITASVAADNAYTLGTAA